MPKPRSNHPAKKASTPSSLMVRLDEDSKSVLVRAAQLRRVSVSDYVRTVTVAQARKEVQAAGEQTLAMTPEEQLAFWTALDREAPLTEPQKKLGRLMRSEE